MTYAAGRSVLDADAHVMEPPGWLESYVDPAARNQLPPMHFDDVEFEQLIASSATHLAARNANPIQAGHARAELMTMARKGWTAYGGCDPVERSHALDELGFGVQVMYPTGAFPQVVASAPQWQEAAALGLNRGMAEFCAHDHRLLPVAYIPFHLGVDAAARILDDAIGREIGIAMLDMVPARDAKAPGHPDHDPLWARIVDADMSATTHVGLDNGWRPVRPSFFDNARQLPHFRSDAPGDALSYMAIGFPAELFLASIVFDGVLERFGGLRISVAELGASWLPGLLRQLDQAHRAFRRLQDLSHLTLAPSDYIYRQVKVTPFAGEDVGWMIAASGPELYTFSSDYPHHEGTDDPIRRFDASLADASDVDRHAFYYGNLADLLGSRLPS